MNSAAWAANPLTTCIADQPPWSDDMTNQGNPVLCEEVGPRQASHQPKQQQLHITEDFTSDEKSQVQALSRSQPAFPMMPGMPEKRTHDYVRHGTTSLFAAFDTSDGKVITSLHRRHRTVEFRKFLNKIDQEVPDHLDVHLVCDNYGTHKTPAIKTWLAAHPRFHMHFTPTYSSWINQVVRHESRTQAVTLVEGGSADAGDVASGPVRKDRPRLGVRRG